MDSLASKVLPSNYTTVMAHARLVDNEIFIPPNLLIRLVAESNTLIERMFCMQLLRTISKTAVVDAMNLAYPGMFWTWTKRETWDPFLAEVTDFINHLNTLTSFHITPLDQRITPLGQQVTSLKQQVTPLNQRITPLEQQVTSLDQQVTPLDQQVTSLDQRVARPGTTLTPLNQRLPRRGAAASDSRLTKSCLKAKPVKYEIMSEDREKTNKIRFKGSEVKLFEWDPDERGSGEKRNFCQLTNIREDRHFKQMKKRMMREAKQALQLHYCNRHTRNK